MKIVSDCGLVPGWLVTRLRPPALSATFVLKGTYRLSDGGAVDEPDLLDPSDFVAFKPRADILLVGVTDGPVSLAVGSFRKRGMEVAAFGPVPEIRRKRAGTYDEKWLRERWPWYPEDFDWSFFNAAPEDQQVPELRGDEEIIFQDRDAVLQSRLPGLRARCFFQDRDFREVPLRLDTIWIDVAAGKLSLVWRGNLEIRSLKLAEAVALVVVTEPLNKPPAPIEAYRPAEPAAPAKQAVLTPPPPEVTEVDYERQIRELESEVEEAGKVEGTLKEALLAEGHDPAILSAPAGPDPTTDEIAARFAEAEVDLEGLDRPDLTETMPAEPEPIPAAAARVDWTRESVLEGVRRGIDFSGQNLSGLDLSGLDLSGARFGGARMARAKMTGARLANADLTRTDLYQAMLAGADLAKACLDKADASGANLSKASLAGASFRGADFSEADLGAAHLAGAEGKGCDFSKANLEKADFTGARLFAASVEGARGPGAIFDRADLTGLHASEAPDFTGAKFREVQGSESCWEGARLDGAEFLGAKLTRADFTGTSLRAAVFDRADLRGAAFADAVLQGARCVQADALRGAFERANLSGADLRGANFYEAEFWDARVDGAKFEGANLRGTKLA